jgi:glyoxylase-like metal-dependent hydrolase (beta-lactamase superfamily II)
MQRTDYSYFVGDNWKKEGDSIDVLKIVQANLKGKLHLIDGDSIEIFPGIRVFIGSKHTYESQYVLINTGKEKVIIASDNIWFYYNLNHMVSIPLTLDPAAYIKQMDRMKRLVNPKYIIPGHDERVLQRFPKITDGIVQIQ